MYYKNILSILFILSSGLIYASADQSLGPNQTIKFQVASLTEDVEHLTKKVGELVLEVEALREENHVLRQNLEKSTIKQNQLIESYNNFSENTRSRFDVLNNKVGKTSKDQEKAIVDKVSQNVEKLLKTTDNQKPTQQTFSENYPKEGIAYIVKPGDTLSGIAKDNHSTVNYIKNANKISDPKNLKAGQTIFVPQENKS